MSANIIQAKATLKGLAVVILVVACQTLAAEKFKRIVAG